MKYLFIFLDGYLSFNSLKNYNKRLKTLLAIGGWNEGSKRLSKLVANFDTRRIFINSAITFCVKMILMELTLIGNTLLKEMEEDHKTEKTTQFL